MAAAICDLTLAELTAHLKAMGEPAYRAAQVFDWIYKKRSFAWEAMSSLPGAVRAKLSRPFPFPDMRQIEMHLSEDGTRKFLFGLCDGQRVESVFIPAEKRATLCISSQAGCKFGCGFCASGLGGWKRDLTPGEIFGQVLLAKKACADAGEVTHIVFMGVGEPFDNYDWKKVLTPTYVGTLKKGLDKKPFSMIESLQSQGGDSNESANFGRVSESNQGNGRDAERILGVAGAIEPTSTNNGSILPENQRDFNFGPQNGVRVDDNAGQEVSDVDRDLVSVGV